MQTLTEGSGMVEQRCLAVDAAGLANRLSISTRHVRRLDSAGKLPSAIKLGKAKRWSLVEVEEWLAAGAPDRVSWEAAKELN